MSQSSSQSSSRRILQQYQQQDARGRYQMLTSFYETGKVGAVKYLMWAAQNDPDSELRTYASQCAQELRSRLGLPETEPAPKLRKVEAPLVTDESLKRKQKQVTQVVSATSGGTIADTMLAITLVVLTAVMMVGLFLPWLSFADVQLTNGVVIGPMVARHQEIMRTVYGEWLSAQAAIPVDEDLMAAIATFNAELPMIETFLLLDHHDSPYRHLYGEEREIFDLLVQEIEVQLSLHEISEEMQGYVPLGYAIGGVLIIAGLLDSLVLGSLLNEWFFERRLALTVPVTGKSFFWLVWVVVALLLLVLGLVFAFLVAPAVMSESLNAMGFAVLPYDALTIVGEGVWMLVGSAVVALPITLLGLVRSFR